MPGIEERDIVLLQRLKAHPALRARVASLLGAVEDAGGDLAKADAAERRMIEALRQMGNEALTAWARDKAEGRSGGNKNATGRRPSARSR